MKKDLRVIKTKDSVRDALLILLKTKSLESMTVAELCRVANINRGTFYSHYKNVHSVFKEYLGLIVEDLKQSYEAPYHRTKYDIKNMEADMIKIFHHVKKYQSFYQIVFDERVPMTYYYMVFDRVRELMEKSVQAYHLNEDSQVQQSYLFSYQTNAILGILIEWHRQDYQTTIQELNQQLMMILSRAII